MRSVLWQQRTAHGRVLGASSLAVQRSARGFFVAARESLPSLHVPAAPALDRSMSTPDCARVW